MFYGVDLPGMDRRTASYVDKILKGRKPADLPVEQPPRFDFVITMNTAKSLGIKIPGSIPIQATKLIECGGEGPGFGELDLPRRPCIVVQRVRRLAVQRW